MASIEYAVFESAIGPLGLAWSEGAIVAVRLPGPDAMETERAVLARVPTATPSDAPEWVREVVELLRVHVAGRPQDLRSIPLSLADQTPFKRRVYELARAIPPGETRTYGELAALAGSPGASRAVGQAMATNPCPLIVPCHRVLAAGRAAGGFTAPGGLTTKARLLAAEGVALSLNAELFPE